jgi:hypothetical protein
MMTRSDVIEKAIMMLAQDLLIAGVCLVVVAAALAIPAGLRAAKQRAEHYRQLPEEYPGLMGDVFGALIWSGMLMIELSSILLHAEPGGIYRVVPLMWVGTAAAVFICGLFAGRLMMRWEMRAYKAKREEQAREARV